MNETERLKKEVKELLAGDKTSTSETKKVLNDEKAKQFVIKIPTKLALGAKLNENKEVKIVVNPTVDDWEEAFNSPFIIYGKTKEPIA